MRDALPKSGPLSNECAVINLDETKGPGTHWVCYKKRGSVVKYYDSYGNSKPPRELLSYFRGCKIYYNFEREQDFNTKICGHLCLNFLYSNV